MKRMNRKPRSMGLRLVSYILLLACLLGVTLSACTRPPAVWEELESLDQSGGSVADGITSSDAVDETQPPEEEDPGEAVKTPVFSKPGGIYQENLAVTLTCSEPYTIHYTTNGSLPTKASKQYKGSISVLNTGNTSTTIRAACFDQSGKIVGDVVTHTYIRRELSSFYTVSISLDEHDLQYLLDHYTESYEKPAHVEVTLPGGQTVISQDAGLRIFGGSSRFLPQKSFKIIARKDGYFGEDLAYSGGGSFKYPLFPTRTVKSGDDEGRLLNRYDSFILRNGGNDSLHHRSVDPEYATMLRDGLANQFANERLTSVDVSLSQFAHVYINGDYYGILDMRENLNEDFVKRVYGVADEDVVVIKSELDTGRLCGEHEDANECRYCGSWFFYETDEDAAAQAELQAWLELCQGAIGAISADETAYAAMYATVAGKVDLQSFMEYMALNMYLCNTDWPHNNVKLWRYTGAVQDGIAITDGKWRFMTRDMDMAFARYRHPEYTTELDNRASVDTFYRVLGLYLDGYAEYYSYEGEEQLYNDALYLQGLLAFCLRNPTFRADFVAVCRDLAGSDSSNCLKTLYKQDYDILSSGIKEHIIRWLRQDTTPQEWSEACASVRVFILERPEYFNLYLERMLSMYA